MAESERGKNEPPGTPRRKVVLAMVAGACALGAGTILPVVVFVAAPLDATAGKARWVKTVRFDQLKDGEPKRISVVDDRRDAWTMERGVELGSVWLVRKAGTVDAFSAVCPHLGCSVNAVSDGGGGFACPCHTSAFALDGLRRGGPAPRDLDRLATRIDDGVVAIEFKRFRIGIPERVIT